MKKILTCLLVAVMIFSLAACGTEQDKEFTILVGGSEKWTPFENASGVTYSNSDNNVISIEDNGQTVTFTGLAVGESIITASYDGKTSKALVKVISELQSTSNGTSTESPGSTTTPGGNTGTKHITYNKPIEAFYIEFNGGYIDANKNTEKGNHTLVLAYENKEHMAIGGYYNESADPDNRGIMSTYHSAVGYGYMRYGEKPGDSYWIADVNNDSSANRAVWTDETYKRHIWPLSEFAAFATGMQTNTLADVAESPVYQLPNKVDVTQYYVRSENVMNTMCDVYEYQDATWWVDPATGFTLKMAVEGGDLSNNWEVTKLVLGSPDWDGLHLCPQKGDIENFFGEERVFAE